MQYSYKYNYTCMGASTIKWTTHNPWLVLSESDSKQYINIESCEVETS